MPFRIVRNDITKMNTEAIVNTAASQVRVGPGCDFAVYNAAGFQQLLKYRQDNIGVIKEGEAFITPGFNLTAKYIIHAVSPYYIDGEFGEENLLRQCYRNSLAIAKDNNINTIAFPLIATGSFGYPKEEGMRVAIDEINAFLLANKMDITLVVFDTNATELGGNIYPELQTYIDQNYVSEKYNEEYEFGFYPTCNSEISMVEGLGRNTGRGFGSAKKSAKNRCSDAMPMAASARPMSSNDEDVYCSSVESSHEFAAPHSLWDDEAVDELNKKLNERLAHRSDTFSEYLLYLIESKGMSNVDVYKRAIVDKRYFAKLKNNKDFHPEKIKALCLCVGAKLNIDETKDLLARAGYALSPADMTDIIFTFFIEHNHFDVIDIDIQLEEHGLPCIIS